MHDLVTVCLLKNNLLVLQRWEREKALMDMEAFYRVPLWVQPWGLPVHFHTEEMGDRIGARPGTVLKVA